MKPGAFIVAWSVLFNYVEMLAEYVYLKRVLLSIAAEVILEAGTPPFVFCEIMLIQFFCEGKSGITNQMKYLKNIRFDCSLFSPSKQFREARYC